MIYHANENLLQFEHENEEKLSILARQVEDMFNVDKQAETEKIRKSKREKSKELNGGGFATQGVFTIDGIDEELMTTYHPAFLKELLKN